MPLTVRRGSGAVEYALVAELDALRRIVAQAAGLFHLEVSSVGGDASYCAQRYRSYDPASGTYLGFDGLRHPCQ